MRKEKQKMALFVWYPKCSTCRKAEAWLKEHGVSFTARHIVEENPTAQELAAWKEQGKLPLKSFLIRAASCIVP